MGTTKKNKNGVTNSLVNNINARKKKGKSRPKKKTTISKKSYSAMQSNWGRPKKRGAAKNTARKSSKKTARKASKTSRSNSKKR